MDRDQTAGLVLIVEDNPANLLLARVMLERSGWQISEARSADEARQTLQTTTPDVILMDVGLPGQDGLSLTSELKSASDTSAIPIVALTAHAMQSDREKAFAAGCDGYLSKPFKAQQLRDEISRVLQTSSRADRQAD
ncbi:MAG TPA: response regulator [Thermomicrobiales bacterium]|nr:response regulator [Thermomicrobiales bacterium]